GREREPNEDAPAAQQDVHQEFGIVDRLGEARIDRERRGHVRESDEEDDAVGREQVPYQQESQQRGDTDRGRTQPAPIQPVPAQGQRSGGALQRRWWGRRCVRFCNDARRHAVRGLSEDGGAAHVLPPPTAAFTASSKPSTLPPKSSIAICAAVTEPWPVGVEAGP
ncbi:hypothetical protein KXW38_002021, partial [Aspergillus fumigatus]